MSSGSIFAATRSGLPARRATSTAQSGRFSGVIRPTKASQSDDGGLGAAKYGSRSRPFGQVATQRRSRSATARRWSSLIDTSGVSEYRGSTALTTSRSRRRRIARRHQIGGGVGTAGREQRDLVPASTEFVGERADDALRAAIGSRRNRF